MNASNYIKRSCNSLFTRTIFLLKILFYINPRLVHPLTIESKGKKTIKTASIYVWKL